MSDWKTGINDDYAVMRGGNYEFYYGYEETNEAGEWLFQVKTKEPYALVFERTAEALGQDADEEPVRVLLEGIATYLDSVSGRQSDE